MHRILPREPAGLSGPQRLQPARRPWSPTAHSIYPDVPEWSGAGRNFRVALCVPMSGSAGIWGPSCLAAAKLAQVELNQADGVVGRPCELKLVDASDESTVLEDILTEYVDNGEVDALVGMHISSVRRRIVRCVGGRLPYVYNALYEGGETTKALYAIGETAPRQLAGSIAWLARHEGARRWALIGNDYIWPRVSHRLARDFVRASGGEVVDEQFISFSIDDYSMQLDRLRAARPDAVLISIVGQDAVEFNRSFAAAGLASRMRRLSCAIEENQLLAMGAENTDGLYVALGYFAALDTDANLSFKERYHGYFGDRAPALNSIGESNYEGLHFLSTLMTSMRSEARRRSVPPRRPLRYASARGAVYTRNGINVAPMYLARADGVLFSVIAEI